MPNSPGLRDGVENPQALAGPHVESAHVAFHVVLALRGAADQMRRADDHHIFRDDGRGMQPISPVTRSIS